MSGSVSSVEGEINAIIKEFLEYSKLKNTLETFEEECRKLGKPIQDHGGKCRRDERFLKIKGELLQHFDEGQRTEFFAGWESHIIPEIRENDAYCHKLEFYLQIHFAVLPMRKIDHWCKEDVEEAIMHFHYYLENKGSLLSGCTEFLPYYALPYVPRPDSHPSFSELFQESWVTRLRNRLETFMYESVKTSSDEVEDPKLIELYHNRDLDLQDARKELQYLERHLEESEKRSVLQAKKCEKLQEECRQLMAVASLLVTALESAIKGNLVDMDCVLSACTTHLPDLSKLKTKSPRLLQSDISFMLEKNDTPSFKLDFKKLKTDLRSAEQRKRALILQALRWRLTKAGSGRKKEESVFDFVDNDLLDLQTNDDQKLKVFESIDNNKDLLESFTRFLNALASFVLGRQYLTSHSQLLRLLLDNLHIKEEKGQDFILDMILGTLKKLSIRRSSQESMVENGAVEWLANVFHSDGLSSDYASAASIALLFNLSLCPSGKKRCEPLKEQLIHSLGRLLQLEDPKIVPYVNGTLYRILSIPSVRNYAKEQSLPTALQKLMHKREGEPKKQLETILELFVTDVQIEDGSSDEEDEDQENMVLEAEIELEDSLVAENNENAGEDLLRLYAVPSAEPEDKPLALEEPKEEEKKPPPQEPLTPKLDVEATQLVRKLVGRPSTTLVEAAFVPDPAAVTIKGLNANEYTVAFSSRPKIPRTPEPLEGLSPKMNSPLVRLDNQSLLYCNN